MSSNGQRYYITFHALDIKQENPTEYLINAVYFMDIMAYMDGTTHIERILELNPKCIYIYIYIYYLVMKELKVETTKDELLDSLIKNYLFIEERAGWPAMKLLDYYLILTQEIDIIYMGKPEKANIVMIHVLLEGKNTFCAEFREFWMLEEPRSGLLLDTSEIPSSLYGEEDTYNPDECRYQKSYIGCALANHCNFTDFFQKQKCFAN